MIETERHTPLKKIAHPLLIDVSQVKEERKIECVGWGGRGKMGK